MVKKGLKNCSATLAISEMQIRTTMRFLLIPFRIVTINKTNDSSFTSLSLSFKIFLDFFYVCECLSGTHVCVPYVYLVPL